MHGLLCVLVDLAVESEAGLWMTMRIAHAPDRAETNGAEGLLARLCTPVVKYWVSKRAAPFVAEALECHGGNGFIAEHLMERLCREAPLNSIWEGSGNVICLDVLRAMQHEPEGVGVLLDEIENVHGASARLDTFVGDLKHYLADSAVLEANARRIVEMMRVRCKQVS
jgi:putative acyl-CoA dehydrogenase